MLLLWDIDHTLVEMRGIGTELFGRAFTEVTGVRMERQAAVDGMTDLVIFHATAALHRITTSPADNEHFTTALTRAHHDALPEIQARGRALPGAHTALTDHHHLLTLLTTPHPRGPASSSPPPQPERPRLTDRSSSTETSPRGHDSHYR